MPDDARNDEPDAELDELRRIGGAASANTVAWNTPPPDLWDRIAAEVASADAPDSTDHLTPTSIESARSPRHGRVTWWIAGAAAAVLLVVAVGVGWSQRSDDGTVLAQVDLERLGDSGEGTAELVDRDGSLQLQLDTDDLADPDGFTEVWLINAELTELVSLGPLRPDGTYAVPTGLDPAVFPVVDVSFEPLDGNPAHSGDSVLRGTLIF